MTINRSETAFSSQYCVLHRARFRGYYKPMRQYSIFDQFLIQVDTALKTIAGKPATTSRSYPAQDIDECELTDSERKHITGLMRVNHAGEVSAQALYQGQSITSRNADIREKLAQAATEENDHLVWTENRLNELGGRTSLLKPIWYAGSFTLGAIAGAIGDKWNLGFLAETEKQVAKHLDEHLDEIPSADKRTRAVLQQMKIDETKHATTAIESGGRELPIVVKKAMTLMSKVMTRTAYYL